jgi:cytochrome c biogenesis protein CcmG/thiol:disulfide interchange protein DsbE
MKRFLAPVIGFLLLSILLGYALIQIQSGEMSPRDIPSPLIGKPLPAFTLQDLHNPGKQYALKDFSGQVYLLNVWASWCVACRQEHPLLKVLPKQEGVLLVGLDYKDKTNDAFAFLKEMGDPYDHILFDPDGKYGIDLGVYGVPETFLVDSNGIIRYKQIGPINQQVWQEKIAPLVRELKLKASQRAKS